MEQDTAAVALVQSRLSASGRLPGTYSITEVAVLLGVCAETLRNWERQGKVPPPARIARTNVRIFTDDDVAIYRAFRDDMFVPVRSPVVTHAE